MKMQYQRIILITIILLSLQAWSQNSPKEMKVNLKKIDKSIEETKFKIQNTKDPQFLAEMYFALAEFHIDKSRLVYNILLAENPGAPVEELDFTQAKRIKTEAIEIYNLIVERFPQHRDRDKALFLKAHEERELGLQDQMLKTHRQMVNEYPKSLYWPDSQISIGDYYFEVKKDFELAYQAYSAVLKSQYKAYNPFAHFKLGWVYINKEKFLLSFKSFEKAILLSRNQSFNNLPQKYRNIDLTKDALSAIVWPYSEISQKEFDGMKTKWKVKPIQYFFKLTSEAYLVSDSLRKLGKRYELKNKFEQAHQVYFASLKITVDLNARIDLIERIYQNVQKSKFEGPISGFVDQVTKDISEIKISKDIPEAQRGQVLKNFELISRDFATRQQIFAKKSGKSTDWGRAAIDYKKYLHVFPEAAEAKNMKINLAESLFNSRNYLEAGKAYEELAFVGGQKEYFESSIESYIMALKEQRSLNKLELLESRIGIRTVGTKFVEENPDHSNAGDTLYAIAQSYYDERLDEAANKIMWKFIVAYPTHQKVALAVNLILDSYNQKEDYNGLIGESKKLLKMNEVKDIALKKQVKQVLEQAIIKETEIKSGGLGDKNYANNLLKIAKKFKGSNLGDKALYEAFVSLKSKRDPQAYETGEQLILEHKDSKHARSVVTDMGQMAINTADFLRAALYFELFHERYPKQNDSQQLLQTAAKIREELGDFKNAQRNYTKLNDYNSAARMDFLSKDWTSLRRTAAMATSVYQAYWLGLANYRLNGMRMAQPYFEEVASSNSTEPEIMEMSAHALYLLSMSELSLFKSVKMRLGEEAQAVSTKSQMLNQLTQQLNRAIEKGSPKWSIAALYALGVAYKEFTAFILSAPLPSGLTSAQSQQVKTQLSNQASTYKKSSVQYFEQCLKTAEKYLIYTKFVKACKTLGRMQVDEAEEFTIVYKEISKEPKAARNIRIKLYEKPRDAQLLESLAEIYIRSRDYSMAHLILKRANDISSSPQLMGKIGITNILRGDYQGANYWFDMARKKNAKEFYTASGLAKLFGSFGYLNKLKSVEPLAKSQALPEPYNQILKKRI